MTKKIEDILKDMPLDESVKGQIVEVWNKSLEDAKVAQLADIRESQAQQYEAELEKMQKSFGIFLEQRLTPHIEDLHDGVKTVEKMKIEYANKTAKLKEAAKAYVNKSLKAIEETVNKRLDAELSELHEDVVANRRATLQAITEKTAAMDKEQEVLKAKTAAVLENIVNVKLEKQLSELREDIVAARKDNFGREIFEAFQIMFRRQFFDSSSEFKKLTEQNEKLKSDTRAIKAKAAKAIRESRLESANAKRDLNKITESVKRHQTIGRLLKPLSGMARKQMKTLLESTSTERLETTFRKSYPIIIKENAAPKKVTTRAATPTAMEFRSGGTQQLAEDHYDDFAQEVEAIRRRAGNQ